MPDGKINLSGKDKENLYKQIYSGVVNLLYLPCIIRRQLREPLADFLLKANPPAGTDVKISTSRKKGHNLKFAATVDGEEVTVEL